MDMYSESRPSTLKIIGVNSRVRDRSLRPRVVFTGLPIQFDAGQHQAWQAGAATRNKVTLADGQVDVSDLADGSYTVFAGTRDKHERLGEVTIRGGMPVPLYLERDVNFSLVSDPDVLQKDSSQIDYGQNIRLAMTWTESDEEYFTADVRKSLHLGLVTRGIDVIPQPVDADRPRLRHVVLHAANTGPASMLIYFGSEEARFSPDGTATFATTVPLPTPSIIEGTVNVGMRRAPSRFTDDLPFWVSIRKSTDALSFDRYFDFMNWLFCNDPPQNPLQTANPFGHMFDRADRRALPFVDTDAYRNIKVATEAFVMANCGIFKHFDVDDAQYVVDQVSVPANKDKLENRLKNDYLKTLTGAEAGVLPYLAIIRRKLIDQRVKGIDIGDVVLSLDRPAVDACYGLLRQKLTCPCLLELIWSYWQEEGMLVQTMNALARRFQNVRSPLGNDPLANLEIDPLRPLNNVIWGYIQDEQHRLSVVRRNYEYDHHYGLRLAGRAVREVRTADSRSKFLAAFHALLSITAAFYKRDDDTTIVADGFPVLNALKEAHLILSQGAHNQYGDLPSTARIEMLMQQWILARPEFREFLPTRIMVAYPEPWMDRVDAMKKLQGWTDTSVLHFRNLAIFGEPILLTIRYGAWADVNDPSQATNWARYWRPEIQGYMHAYRSVTGVDLTVDVTNVRIDATMPSVHLVQRLAEQRRIA